MKPFVPVVKSGLVVNQKGLRKTYKFKEGLTTKSVELLELREAYNIAMEEINYLRKERDDLRDAYDKLVAKMMKKLPSKQPLKKTLARNEIASKIFDEIEILDEGGMFWTSIKTDEFNKLKKKWLK